MDPNQINHFSSMMAGLMGVFLLIGLACMAFFIFLFWRILEKAGLAGPLALLLLIWPIGLIVVACILAFSTWKVIPAPYVGLQPYPPPPPNYPPPPPPTGYAPPPPTQL